jgi:hypothetical protein
MDWLLDPADPSSRLRALRELLDKTDADTDVREARAAVLESPAVTDALAARKADGSWGDLGKEDSNRGTAWMLSWLLQLGVMPRDARLITAARALLNARQTREKPADTHWPDGAHGTSSDPADAASCVTGDNLALSLTVLGPIEENRRAMLWLLRNQRHDGGWLHCHRWSWTAKSTRYLPGRKLTWPEETDPSVRSCRYGTFRAMRALATLPEELRDPIVRKALTRGAEFFLVRGVTGSLESPGTDAVPKVKSFNAGFALLGTPVRQTLDMLAVGRLLTDLGYGPDPRLAQTVHRVQALQEVDGWWRCDSAGPGMWPAEDQPAGLPSKRITIDAIAFLRRVSRSSGIELRLR